MAIYISEKVEFKTADGKGGTIAANISAERGDEPTIVVYASGTVFTPGQFLEFSNKVADAITDIRRMSLLAVDK